MERPLKAGTQRAHSRGAVIFALLLAAALFVDNAEANSFRTFGLGPRAVAMGGAFTAVADDFSAGYYNPAGILVNPGTKFGLGYHYVKEDLTASGEEVDFSRDAESVYMGAALTMPFTDEWKDKVGLGFLFLQPIFYSIDILIPELTKPQYPTLESMARMQIIHLAMALDLIPGVLIGAGATFSSDLGGELDLKPGVSGFGGVDEVLGAVDQEVHPIISGTAGILVRPGEFHERLSPFTFGFVWRDYHYLDLDIPVSVVLSGFLLRLDLTSAFLYTPRQWVTGLAYRPTPELLLAFDVSINEWSAYEVPSLSIATDIDIPFIVLKEGINEPAHFNDTVTPKFGLEYLASSGRSTDTIVRAGYAFEPTPVPEQTGRTNYLDSDRHIVSWGLGLMLKRFWKADLSRRPISLDLGVAYHWLPERLHRKDEAVREDNPGYPEVSSSGGIWYFTAGLSFGLGQGTPASAEE